MELCSRAVIAEDDKEVQRIVAEVRDLLHERIEELRQRLILTTMVSILASDRSVTGGTEGPVSANPDMQS